MNIKKWSYNPKGELQWRGHSVVDVLRDQAYSKPIYFYDLAYVQSRAKFFKEQAPHGAEIFYAMKANSHPEVLRTLDAASIGMDVVSLGEIELAVKAGVLPSKIIFSGVGKTKHEITEAIKLQVRQINVESLPELERIANIAQKLKSKVSVVLRVNPDVNVTTHPYIATGFRDNKFGIDQQQLEQAVQILKSNSFVEFKGFSQHIGSQIFNVSDFAEAFSKMMILEKQFRQQGLASEVLDVGGGLGIFYDQDNEEQEQELCIQYMKSLMAVVESSHLKTEVQNRSVRIQFEPGRWLVGHAGFLLSQVQYVKSTAYKNFLILDTGMHHLMRPCLYEAYHEILPVVLRSAKETYDVVGPICESSDFLARDRQMTQTHPEDFVVIADCGAYGYSMASNYNAHQLPEERLWPR